MWQKVAKFKGAEYFRKALYGQICQMVGEGELCMHLCVWSKNGLVFFSGCTCDMLVKMR